MPRYAYHNPRGVPCDCGVPLPYHRIAHQYDSDGDGPCKRCGLPEENHYRKAGRQRHFPYNVGIDGEGQGRDDHRYVLLAWSDEKGKRRGYIEAKPGERLTTVQCLDLILSIPKDAKPFGFALGYDLTKILTDVDDETLWYLFRPERRQRPKGYEMYGPKPVTWNGYSLNLQGSKFTVAKGDRRTVVWDTFKFYQAKFTSALTDWLDKEPDYESRIKPSIERMVKMKDQRENFDKLDPEAVKAYCFEECAFMALLTRRLNEAHVKAGLDLRSWHGAGSTASCVLKKLDIGNQARSAPAWLDEMVAAAFFGGRFENSVVGHIPGPIYGYDISSAYPYQLTFLPCLGCGSWEYTSQRKDLEGASAALVHYGLGVPRHPLSWGPFPFRMEDGAIAFPDVSGGGWLWKDEYLAGERAFPHVQFKEAWVYRTECAHQPFAEIPRYYLERLRIGKEGPGIVIKLGCNACYGKLAQSLGVNPPFQSWVWAGMITAGTRAQLLDLIRMHKRRANVLMVATDGLYSREKLDPPLPRETGTGQLIGKGKKTPLPLGGWERKIVEKGMFAARPGIYFPLNPTADEIKEVRARGVGRASMLENWRLAIEAYDRGEDKVKLANVSRFHGAKSSISRSRDPNKEGAFIYTRQARTLDEDGTLQGGYGQWSKKAIEMTFNPRPKREYERADHTLAIRSFSRDVESLPYKNSLKSAEALLLKAAAEEAMEQPDGFDYSDYETEVELG